jgi:hypothetical protein
MHIGIVDDVHEIIKDEISGQTGPVNDEGDGKQQKQKCGDQDFVVDSGH